MLSLPCIPKRITIVIPFLIFSSHIKAEADDAVTLDELVVTSTRTDTKLKDSSQVVTLISREQIEQQLKISSDSSQVLSRLIPSFTPARQKLSSAGETFRGRPPLFLIDGVPQSNPLRDTQRDGHTIDLSMVEKIEIIHGASAIHGLGATGGMINFITRRPSGNKLDQDINVQVTMPTSDIGSDTLGYRTNYGLRGSQDDWEYAFGITYDQQGMYTDANHELIGVDNTQGDTMDSKSYDIFGKLGYWLNDDQHLELQVNRYQLKSNNDYTGVTGDRSTQTPATSIRQSPSGQAPHNRVLTTNFKYDAYDLAGMHFSAQVYQQNFEALFGVAASNTFFDPTLATDRMDQSQATSTKKGAKFTLTKDDLLDDKLSLTTGLDILHDTTEQTLEKTNRSWVPETTFKNYAPFLQAQFKPIDSIVLNAGVRYEKAKLDVGDFHTLYATNGAGGVDVEGGNPDFSETLYNAGVVISPLAWISLFANYSQGFGMPDVGRVLRGISTENQSVSSFLNLKPIITTNREIGLRIDWQPVDIEMSYYESNSDFGSRLDKVGDDYFVRREKTEISGVETTIGYQATEDQRVEMSYSLIRGRYDSNDDGETDTDLDGNNIPPNRLLANWSANWSTKWSSYLQVSHNMSRKFEKMGVDNAKFNGYSLVDASLSRSLPKGTINLSIANLLNEDYFDYYSQAANTLNNRYFKGRGRTVTLGYALDF